MCGTEQPKEQPQIGDRGSNPVAINQFLIFFSIGFTCSRFLFSFANILYFTWLTSFDLILLSNSSYVFAQLFLLKMRLRIFQAKPKSVRRGRSIV